MDSLSPTVLFFSDAPASDAFSGRESPMRLASLAGLPEDQSVEIAVVDGRTNADLALDCCRSIRAKYPFASITFVSTNESNRIAALRCGADALVADAAGDELAALNSSQVRRREQWSALRRKAEDADILSRQLQQAFSQIKLDLEMAGRLQASFLPKLLPQIGKVRFASYYRPCGPVGGDFFDVIRLDERHIGFYVADVMGHGVPAGLLTIYLKRAVTTKDISPTGYRIVPPHEVLGRLNREIIAAEIAEQPFATMAYGVINVDTGKVSLSRAAHPYPILIGANGTIETWEIPGKMLGVFESEFQSESRQLAPGDKLLLSTDGAFPERRANENPNDTALFNAIKSQSQASATEFVGFLAEQFIGNEKRADDATMLALEFLA